MIKLGEERNEDVVNQNVAPWDRVFRVVVGVVLLAMAVFGAPSLWGLLGVLPLITGGTGVSPLYRAFGITSYGSGYRDLHAH
jgi:hypothetical protein